jgi:hypothetical protein
MSPTATILLVVLRPLTSPSTFTVLGVPTLREP